jgi:predicted secreted protein
MDKIHTLMERLEDTRSKNVIFLSHCLLNENTRYLGGACCGGCVKEILAPYLRNNIGIVQMPCPEQQAWGGVLKKHLLRAYGTKGTWLHRFRFILLPLMLWYTTVMHRRLARAIARQVKDYLTSGFSVVGIVGVDGSPSCGVNKTLAFTKSFDLIANVDIKTITVKDMNHIIRQSVVDGSGRFTTALKEELTKRNITVPYQAYDLMAELEGTL